MKGSLSIADLLLSHKANVNALDEDMNTPLHLASIKGDAAMAELMVDQGGLKHARNVRRLVRLPLSPDRRHLVLMARANACVPLRCDRATT